jgi:RimJ/RimL family protein N-acetyltransferase
MSSGDAGLLRRMTPADVTAVLDVQQPAAVVGLAGVFPQHAYPFPREAVRERWLREVVDPGIDCHVVISDGAVAGFAAIRHDELMHFGIALEHWGSGLAGRAHDAVIALLAHQHLRRAWLLAFTENHRGRRFYEKHGWTPTGERARSTFPPRPELMRYERDIEPGNGGRGRLAG